MNHSKIFKDEILHNFDFKGEYVGYVVDNSEFETTLKIKVFIPELFGFQYTNNMKNIDSIINISKSHLQNANEINITSSINKQMYLYARILLKRDSLTTKENFIKSNKPNIGDKVLVSFFNNNPNNCIYENDIFLNDGENLVFTQSGEYIIVQDPDKKSNDSKTIWKYI